MSNIRIIHTPTPRPVPTKILLIILWRRFANFMWYIWFTARTKIPQMYITTAALGFACFLAFKSERILPGAEPTCTPIPPDCYYVDPLPQVPTLEEYVVETIDKSRPTKPAKFKNRAGALPPGYDVFGTSVYHLIAHESFRPTPYQDGKYPSIGFGLNLTPTHKEWGAKILGLKRFPSRITWEQGKKLLTAYINERLAPEFPDNGLLTPQQRVAKIVHAYNRGSGSADNVHNCCGGRKGCGSRDKNIRSAHTKRRIWETLAWQGKLTPAMIEQDRKKAIAKQHEARKNGWDTPKIATCGF